MNTHWIPAFYQNLIQFLLSVYSFIYKYKFNTIVKNSTESFAYISLRLLSTAELSHQMLIIQASFSHVLCEDMLNN